MNSILSSIKFGFKLKLLKSTNNLEHETTGHMTYNRVCPRFPALSYEHYYTGRNRGEHMVDTLDKAYAWSLRKETIEITKKGDHKKQTKTTRNSHAIFKTWIFHKYIIFTICINGIIKPIGVRVWSMSIMQFFAIF